MTYGKLYGVGVGPGAPDLITLRALAVLRKAQVLVLPRGSDYGSSMAYRIVEPALGAVPEQERLFLTFPMSHDADQLRHAWQKALTAIGERLERGRSVAFVSEGDPSLFSSFIYLQREAPKRWPGIEIEVVPGISSVMAVPAVTGVPLADGVESVAILPAAYRMDDLHAALDRFDTVVLMKIGPSMAAVVRTLEERGLLSRAVYVSRASQPEQRIVRNLHEISETRGDCFAMVIVSKKEQNGALIPELTP